MRYYAHGGILEMANHYIVKCEGCGEVVRQCRCPSWGQSKPIMYETCEECKKKVFEELEKDGDTERNN